MKFMKAISENVFCGAFIYENELHFERDMNVLHKFINEWKCMQFM